MLGKDDEMYCWCEVEVWIQETRNKSDGNGKMVSRCTVNTTPRNMQMLAFSVSGTTCGWKERGLTAIFT